MRLNDVFTFGKFKGHSLKDVMADKGSYVGWCLENIPNFCIEPKEVEESFLKGYSEWKQGGRKGLTKYYGARNVPPTAYGVAKTMINNLYNNL